MMLLYSDKYKKDLLVKLMKTTFYPNITIDTIGKNDMLNSYICSSTLTITGTTTDVLDGNEVSLILNKIQYTNVSIGGTWEIIIPPANLLQIPTGETLVSVSVTSRNQTATSFRVIYVKQSLPTISINSITNDNILNIAECSKNLTVTGTTTNVENGQTATITFQKTTYTSIVSSNAWSVVIPYSVLAKLQTSGYLIYGSVKDIPGDNAYIQKGFSVNLLIPEITIDAFVIDNLLTVVKKQSDQVVSGTTLNAEDGQIVKVTLNGKKYNATVKTNSWSTTIPSKDLQLLPGGRAFIIKAVVSNIAGNSNQSLLIITTTPIPIITITPFTNLVSQAITGTTINVENGNTVTVTINNKTYKTAVYDKTYTTAVSEGGWSITLPTADINKLLNYHTYVITADVKNNIGDPAPEATYNFYVEPPPLPGPVDGLKTITISNPSTQISIGGCIDGLTISGTSTNIANEKIVTVTLTQDLGLNPTPLMITQQGNVIYNKWSATLDGSQMQSLITSSDASQTVVSAIVAERYAIIEDHFLCTVVV